MAGTRGTPGHSHTPSPSSVVASFTPYLPSKKIVSERAPNFQVHGIEQKSLAATKSVRKAPAASPVESSASKVSRTGLKNQPNPTKVKQDFNEKEHRNSAKPKTLLFSPQTPVRTPRASKASTSSPVINFIFIDHIQSS